MSRKQRKYNSNNNPQKQSAEVTRMQGIISQLHRTTEALTKSDIERWRKAWQMAISIEYPNRQPLYDIYRDCEIDAHLSGCISQRKGFVMAKSFKVVDTEGNSHEEAEHYLRQQWFKDLLRLALDAVYWGHSLIELGDIVTDGDGCPCYSGVRLIPRKYVIPEYHRVITDLGQDWTTGIDYHDPAISAFLIECGRPDDLGLLLKAAQQTIPKKNVMAFWDTFAEIFGMPMRIGHTTVRDSGELRKMERMLQQMSAAQYAMFPEGTDIEIKESAKGDAFNVYDKRIDRANSELSKLIIGQTMTIEDGSSLSQSQTHLQVFQNLVDEDADMLADMVNNQLLPRMVKQGFPVQGMRFEWDETIDYTPEQQLQYEQMIADRYEVDPQYFIDKYNVPVGERRQTAAALEMAKGKGQKPFFD